MKSSLIGFGALLLGLWGGDERKPLSRETFEKVNAMVRPYLEFFESQSLDEIDWFVSVHEARKRAAAEGKPIFVCNGKPTWLGWT